MAIIKELDVANWEQWLSERPQSIQQLAKQLPPDRLYRMNSTGHRVELVAYYEDGTLAVNVSGRFNYVTIERNVFGIQPDDLMECDLPPDDEPLGVAITDQDEVKKYIDRVCGGHHGH